MAKPCPRCDLVHATSGLSAHVCEDCRVLIPSPDVSQYRCDVGRLHNMSAPRVCQRCAELPEDKARANALKAKPPTIRRKVATNG